METFTEEKNFVENPRFADERRKSLKLLHINAIDAPIRDIISGFAALSCCFTLQSCYGHFVTTKDQHPENLDPLPAASPTNDIVYRIAYIALCIQDSALGRTLQCMLASVPSIDPEYIQFGCAEWFWRRQVNSYVLQVEPERDKYKDRTTIKFNEALHLEKIRNEFFDALRKISKNIY